MTNFGKLAPTQTNVNHWEIPNKRITMAGLLLTTELLTAENHLCCSQPHSIDPVLRAADVFRFNDTNVVATLLHMKAVPERLS